MFSRAKLFRSGGVALLFVALSACGLKFGETPQISSLELGMSSTACFKGGDQILVNLVQGKAREDEVSRLWDCATGAIQIFTEKTQGQRPGLYSPNELRGFLESYFLNSGNLRRGDPGFILISDRLLSELMELKRTLVGGKAEVLTAQELAHSQRVLQIFKAESLRLRSYFPLTSDHYAGANEVRLREARAALQESAYVLGGVLSETGYNYSFSHLDAFLDELQKASSTPEIAEKFAIARKTLPLLESLKAFVVGQDPALSSGLIGGKEWVRLLSAVTQGYGIYLGVAHERAHWPTQFYRVLSEGRSGIVEAGSLTLDLLDEVARQHRDEAIPLSSFENLIDQLWSDQLPFGRARVDREHMKQLLCPIALRILAHPPVKGDPCPNPAGNSKSFGSSQGAEKNLTRAAIRRARRLLEEWSEGQNFLDLIFEKYAEKESGQEPDRLERSALLAISIPQAYGKVRDEISKEVWSIASRIRSLISLRRPFFRESDEIVVAPTHQDPVFSRRDLSYLNLMNFVSRVFVTAYSSSADKVLSEEDLKRAYFDFRSIGIDLKVFDPRKSRVYKKRFLEANLFTFEGDGDALLSVEEFSQILAYMFSSKTQARRAHDLIADICNHRGQIGSLLPSSSKPWLMDGSKDPSEEPIPTDIFGQELIDADCYRREYFRNYEYLWANVPGLKKYYSGLSFSKRLAVQKDLELVARSQGYTQEPFESTDSESLAGLAHYVETFFERFDVDGDGILNEKEAVLGPNSAFVTLKNTLASLSCDAGHCISRESDLEDLFTYLLYYGEIPGGKFSFIRWKAMRPFIEIQADRSRMIQIMAKFSAAINGRILAGP